MTTTEAFETLMPEPCGYARPYQFYSQDQLREHPLVKDDPLFAGVYTAAQMRAMFDAATERAARKCLDLKAPDLGYASGEYHLFDATTLACAAAIRAREDGVAG